MHKISEVIVVEGRYDKNTLSQVVDAVIIETSGFGVFNNKEKQQREAEIDKILDKIRRSGYSSLTEEEKKRLFEQKK